MIAMQYRFVLPAGYDMDIIEQRIADKGRFTDGLEGLMFKAYLYSRTDDSELPAQENSYAPFYLWRGAEGMNAFLAGPGFRALTQSFGWPPVKTWPVWDFLQAGPLAEARTALVETAEIAEHTPLDALQLREAARAADTVQLSGALAALYAYDPTTWRLVRVTLWSALPPQTLGSLGKAYRIGHVSTGANES